MAHLKFSNFDGRLYSSIIIISRSFDFDFHFGKLVYSVEKNIQMLSDVLLVVDEESVALVTLPSAPFG